MATSHDSYTADEAGADHFLATLRRAQVYAEEQGHRQVTLEHLLLALTEDPDALAVFDASRIDVDRLRDDVAGFVSRIPDRVSGEGIEPVLSPDLARVVEAARQAAQQSRRQVVNGAIVLAALIGEGRSPAAEFLKSHGLTFEEAIRTLQSRPAATSGRPAQRPEPVGRAAQPAPETKPAQSDADDDILASIRTEVSKTQEEVGYERAPPAYVPKAAPATAPPSRREPPLGQYGGADGMTDPVPPSQRGPPQQAPAEPRTGRPPLQRQMNPNMAPSQAASPDRMRAPGPMAGGPPPGAPGWRPPGPPPAGGMARPMGPPPMAGRVQMPPGAPGLPPGAPPLSRTGRAQQPGNAVRPPVDASIGEGTLLENIPRRMRVGVPEQVEVRIARGAFEGLGDGMAGQAIGHKITVAKAMSVRLRAPEGGFYIEATSPETQWTENTLGILSDDFASWRWTVTPHYRGKARLQLVVSARSVAADGLAAETALPEQVIEVRVRTNYGRMASRLVLWLAAMAAAGIIGAMGEAGFRFFSTIIG